MASIALLSTTHQDPAPLAPVASDARHVKGEYAGCSAAFPESTSAAPTASPPVSSLSPASGEGGVVVSMVVVVVEEVDEEIVVVLCSKISDLNTSSGIAPGKRPRLSSSAQLIFLYPTDRGGQLL